jgi:hypothetical protein
MIFVRLQNLRKLLSPVLEPTDFAQALAALDEI